WLGRDLTQDEFNAIDLPEGWIKNQPREGEPDESAFARSPDAAAEGEFTDAEHFGHSWRHNATVIEANTPLDDDGLLRLNRIAKFHEIRFNAGRTLFVLVSPEGELFVRISRDANRTRETPTLPSGWQIVEHTIDEELVFDLPNPTMNIRGDNEDSFQGPVPELDGMIDVQVTSPGLELSPTLCDDPSHLAPLLESIQASDGDDAFGGVNEEQLQRMLMAPTDGPFYMFNLIRYRDQAVYPDGRDTDLTGREANALYSPTEFIQAIGARIVFNTAVHDQIDGDDVLWDDIAIVEYPCPLAFLAMTTNPDFQARAIHKTAGVAETIIMVTHLRPIPGPTDPDQSEAAFPPTGEDPAFDLIHVMDFHDIAQYDPDADEPERTGEDAWEMYQASGQGASSDLGHYPTAILDVQGVFAGDDRSWNQIQMVHMSSMAGFQALLDDDTRQAGRYHRTAALQHNYSMITFPNISAIPYADDEPGSGSGSPLEVTDDGVGTLCSTDADCPGDGVNTCLADGGMGFCTREGCGAGECGSPYLCCRGCSEVAAGMLPFEGSACLPGNFAGQLTAAPLSCTCD
ncbi:MAG: hypothetical protein AAFX99_21805, partial [Myxococcota bacterium]